jgi:hypothetical protein
MRRRGKTAAKTEVYLGLYCCCHMKGPAALPTQYAESNIALTVTLFVWPAVTLESQDIDSTKLVVPTPVEVKVKAKEYSEESHR